jgi:Coiled-coil domain of unknown function
MAQILGDHYSLVQISPQLETYQTVMLGSHSSLASSSTNDEEVSPQQTRQEEMHDSRIASLEKTIEYIQSEHSKTLADLHGEIKRLQELCCGKSF